MLYFPLTNLVSLEVRGKDRTTFLNNLCTQNLKHLGCGECRELFMTDVKGKIQAHGFATAFEESLLLTLINPNEEKILSHLDRYIIREDVGVVNVTSELAWFVLEDRWSDLDKSPTLLSQDNLWRYSRVPIQAFGDSFEFHSWVLSGSNLGCRVIAIDTNQASKFREDLEGRNCQFGSREDLELKRIQLGFPWFGIDFDASHLPQEIDRDAGAIAFDKGCYLGQETVARLDALGQIQKKLCRVRIRTAEPGDVPLRKELVLGEKQIGELRSTAWNQLAGCVEGFAWLRRGYFEIGTRIQEPDRVVEVVRAT